MEMAKQIDAEMDKSEYRPPHRNCTPSGSQDLLGANVLENVLVQGIIAKQVLRSQGCAIADQTPARCSSPRFRGQSGRYYDQLWRTVVAVAAPRPAQACLMAEVHPYACCGVMHVHCCCRM